MVGTRKAEMSIEAITPPFSLIIEAKLKNMLTPSAEKGEKAVDLKIRFVSGGEVACQCHKNDARGRLRTYLS